MNTETPFLSIIIPAYNEEKRILKTLQIVHAYLLKQSFTWEIIVVIDGAKDNTQAVIETFANTHDLPADKGIFRCIDRKENRGKGYTVREGFLKATGQFRLFTDADNSTDISHFDKMLPLFQEGSDIVICSRDFKDAPGARQAVQQPFFKRLLGNAGNLYIQLMAVPGIWDTQCGFKAFSAESVDAIFNKTIVDGWAFDIEALAVARHIGYKIDVVGAYWIDADGTHVKGSDYLKTILETAKIRKNLLTGVYS